MRYKNNNWNTAKKVYNQQYYVCHTQYGYKNSQTAESCDCGLKKVEAVNQAVIEYLLELAKNQSNIDDKIKEITSIDNLPNNDKEHFISELAKIEKNKSLVRRLRRRGNQWKTASGTD